MLHVTFHQQATNEHHSKMPLRNYENSQTPSPSCHVNSRNSHLLLVAIKQRHHFGKQFASAHKTEDLAIIIISVFFVQGGFSHPKHCLILSHQEWLLEEGKRDLWMTWPRWGNKVLHIVTPHSHSKETRKLNQQCPWFIQKRRCRAYFTGR